MKVEKRSSNKIGLIILLIVVLAGLGCGGFFLYKHKDKLNIDWDLSLPWQKKEDNNTNSADNKVDNKQKTQETVTFQGPEELSSSTFEYLDACTGEFKNFKETDKEFIVTFSITGYDGHYDTYCEVNIVQYAVDGYFVPGSTKVEVQPGETKEGEIKILKSDLEAQELSGINRLTIQIESKFDPEEPASRFIEEATFTNNRSVKNQKTGIKVDEVNNTIIQYYKTTTDATNTYLYFILENKSDSYLADIKIRKLIVNDKVFDTKEFDEQLGFLTKKVIYIAVPKKEFNKVKKFTISFFDIATDINTKEKSYYISNEYSKEY